MNNLYLGIMSGTSLDGVDIALCEIDSLQCKLLEFSEFPFPKELKKRVLFCISNKITLKEIGELDTQLGMLFSQTILNFLKEKKRKPQEINAIGLHGQTLWHEPHSKSPFSMQLGSASVVVAQTEIKTIADFRNLDIAYGGEGAPFAPAFHQFLYNKTNENIAVLNIGGMANISLLGENLLGWDTGCGNVLLDYSIQKSQNKAYDKDGEFAKSGKLSKELLAQMLQDNYFLKPAPKSTGREYFNAQWLEKHLLNFRQLNDASVQRTLLELTALSIVNDLKQTSTTQVIVCGGGAKNLFLMQRIKELSGLKVKISPQSDALEAMAFAWLAYKRLENEEVELKSVTGAKKNTKLGAIYG
jgi:anhydro-N-acetylmuramic acid kinase